MAAGYGAGRWRFAPSLSNEYHVASIRYRIRRRQLAELRRDVERSILSTFGILPSLVDPKASGTALREARRQYHAGTVVPLGYAYRSRSLSESLNENITARHEKRPGDGFSDACLVR